MHFTRPRDLVVAGLVALAFVYIAFKFAYGSMPRLPTLAGATLIVLAVIEALLAFSIRARIRQRRVTSALAVVRAVALAKASSMLGALMLGAWLGVLAALLPRVGDLAAATGDVRSALVGTPSAIVLIAAGLWLEYCCRTPEGGDRKHDDHPTG
ncbi:DUF3180 domain-containing protein [Amycolatopsis taiwanensis]|uniref:DUF3180 domain-containing protein n=1 Tax=Amycolatopsis taiwanensis TaxID=342230 RepID=UPI00048529AE|nr:DUF3180 domain-containing protein [Amycolatopsis taiwanensis]